MRRALPFAVAAAVVAIVVVGLLQAGGEGEKETGFSLPEARKQLAGAPPALAGLHADANEILDVTPEEFRAKLRELRGHPVVINKWASWCGPCRIEFPHFQAVGAARGKEVAFIGLNTADNRVDALGFLADFPLPFPSFADPKAQIARELGIERSFPTTLFLDAKGRVAFIHQGQYRRAADLTAEIDRYLG